MARIAKHIQIARANGAEAGLTALVQYLNTPLGLANTHVAEVREKLQACGNFDAALPLYEELFLSEDDTDDTQEDGGKNWLTTYGVVETPAKPKRPRKAASQGKVQDAIQKLANEKPRTWKAFWVAKNGIPTEVGAEFTYTSKKYGTTSKHRVLSVAKNGDVTTRRISLTRKGR